MPHVPGHAAQSAPMIERNFSSISRIAQRRLASYINGEEAQQEVDSQEEEESVKLMETVFGHQFNRYNVNEEVLTSLGYDIPQSARRANSPCMVVTPEDRGFESAGIYDIDLPHGLPSPLQRQSASISDESGEFDLSNTIRDSESVAVAENVCQIIDAREDDNSNYMTILDDQGRIIIDLVTPITANSAMHQESAEIYDAETPELTPDDSIDESISPEGIFGYDASPATLHYFNQAAVHVTTRELVDDFVAAQSTNLAGGVLDIDEHTEAEHAHANAAFFKFGATSPAINQTKPRLYCGFVDSEYTGSPGTAVEQQVLPAQDVAVDDLADPDYYLGPDVPFPEDLVYGSPVQQYAAAQVSQSRPHSAVSPPFSTITPSYSTASSRKRAASFEEEEEDFVVTKKARTACKGFAGQFQMMIPPVIDTENNESAEEVSFGDHKHINGTITNPAFVKDPYFHSLDWEMDVRHNAELQAIMAHARVKTEIAEKMGRRGEEEEMRRSSHLECSEARLTGRAVGFFRYEEGTMTVKEYTENGLCVCWEGCWCSKLCTRYGDVLCPCAKHLILSA